MPTSVRPMKAVSGELPVDESTWAFEVKWDGVRAIGLVEGDLRLQSSNLIDITGRYPELAGLGAVLEGHDCVLDGEIALFDDSGRPSFGLLQHRMHLASPREAAERAAERPVCYLLFDLLHLDGTDTTPFAYTERRALLEKLVPPGPCWRVSPAHPGEGTALLDAAKETGLEGVMAKKLDSRYEIGRRSPNWRKVKVRLGQEFVVGGWTPGERGRSGQLGALLLGYYDDGWLRYAGKVGTGFTDRELRRLAPILAERAIDASPFDPPPPPTVSRVAQWTRPDLVAQVEFGEWTPDGILRHPSYLGLRDDKDPQEVVRETR